jgi:hypothetical protein
MCIGAPCRNTHNCCILRSTCCCCLTPCVAALAVDESLAVSYRKQSTHTTQCKSTGTFCSLATAAAVAAFSPSVPESVRPWRLLLQGGPSHHTIQNYEICHSPPQAAAAAAAAFLASVAQCVRLWRLLLQGGPPHRQTTLRKLLFIPDITVGHKLLLLLVLCCVAVCEALEAPAARRAVTPPPARAAEGFAARRVKAARSA